MSEAFLVAHKVRGAAAFDVAERMNCPLCHNEAESESDIGCAECDETGYWWIIPTSGHRAYPWWYINLLNIDDTVELAFGLTTGLVEHPGPMPPAWPDHYRHGPAPKLDIKALFKTPAKPHIARRL